MHTNDCIAGGRFDNNLGIWYRVPAERMRLPVPALFLDRDGVIVEDPGYLCRPGDMVIISGAAELIATANRQGVPVVEVTNQAGIGRGYYGWTEFLEVETALADQLAHSDAAIDATLACPYHRDGVPPWEHPAHPARKPRPGMLYAAAQLMNLDLKNSWIVGDKNGDLMAGYAAGLKGALHVLTGHGAAHRAAVLHWATESFTVRLGESIRDAASLVDLLAPSGDPHSSGHESGRGRISI